MKKAFLAIPFAGAILLTSCSVPNQKPALNVNPYLSERERKVVNDIIFEVQQVLDTLDSLKSSDALPYLTKLNYPGWVVEKKEEKLAFITTHKLIATKEFTLPRSCIKDIGGAELNVCHMKLTENFQRLSKAFDCDVKGSSVYLDTLKERVKIICSY
jgi:hypothetical protein